MNNFIVGQVTPDMISGMRYGKAQPRAALNMADIAQAPSSSSAC
jgi:hypothetical protein